MSKKEYCIYALLDPRTAEICYVGQTVNLRARLRQHRTTGKTSARLSRLRKELLGEGLAFQDLVLEVCESKSEADEQERWWIACGREQGWPLLNVMDGGEACHHFLEHFHNDPAYQEKRRKISERLWVDHPEMAEKLFQGSRDYWADPANRQKQSEAQIRRWEDPDALQKKCEITKSLWADPEYREKQERIRDDPEFRAKMSAATKRAWEDPERIRRHKEGQAKRWADPAKRKKHGERISQALKDPDLREKLSRAAKKNWADPEFRRKMCESFKNRKKRR